MGTLHTSHSCSDKAKLLLKIKSINFFKTGVLEERPSHTCARAHTRPVKHTCTPKDAHTEKGCMEITHKRWHHSLL